MIRLLFALFAVIITAGCNDGQKFSIPNFKNIKDAKITVLSEPDEVLPFSLCMNVSDSLITLVGELDGKLFHTYDRKTGKLLGQYVDRGQGPDDMIYPGRFIRNKSGITVQDLYTRVIKRFDKDWKCVSSEFLDFGKMEKNAPRDIIFMPDGKLFVLVFIQSFMPLGMQIKDGDRYGEVYSDFPVKVEYPESAGYSYERIIQISPDGKKMVAVSAEGLIFETFDIDNLQIKLKALQFYYPFEMEKPNGTGLSAEGYKKTLGYDKFNIKGIGAMTSTDNRIISVYNDSYDISGFKDITVWDWEAKPLRRYHTDKEIMAIALSPDNPDEIYALGKDKGGEVELLLINCPGLLD